jgi:hypothetical protein
MSEKPTGFEQMYPNIAEWVNSYGWIEIGDDGQSSSFVRALNEGGLVWEDNDDDATLNEVLKALDSFLAAFLAEQMSQCGEGQSVGDDARRGQVPTGV